VLYADIMLLPLAMGIRLHIVDAVGPIIEDSLGSPHDIEQLQPLDVANIAYLKDTIVLLRQMVNVPIIGFSAAPFTLASYLIEGEPTRSWTKTKRFMYEQPEAWHSLMDKLSTATIAYLAEQIDAGAHAVQLFDSWVGCLSPADYRVYVLPYTARIFEALAASNVPRIHFSTDTTSLLADLASLDCEVIGVDWRTDLAYARQHIGDKALQGNLDPAVLLAGKQVTLEKTSVLLDTLPSRTGYIFNLGHRIEHGTSDALLKTLVSYIHERT
jgi:uroporphyrinogen decarboxylase